MCLWMEARNQVGQNPRWMLPHARERDRVSEQERETQGKRERVGRRDCVKDTRWRRFGLQLDRRVVNTTQPQRTRPPSRWLRPNSTYRKVCEKQACEPRMCRDHQPSERDQIALFRPTVCTSAGRNPATRGTHPDDFTWKVNRIKTFLAMKLTVQHVLH